MFSGLTARSRIARDAIAEDKDVRNYQMNYIQLKNVCASGGDITKSIEDCREFN